MKYLRLSFGLALIPLCAFLGSFIHIGTGSAAIIGLIPGTALSYLFLTYGPGKRSVLPTSYYLSHQHQMNSGVNQQAIESHTLDAREAGQETAERAHGLHQRF